jgi:hypothetical protein
MEKALRPEPAAGLKYKAKVEMVEVDVDED